jgi:flagellar biosynthesis protein FlhG
MSPQRVIAITSGKGGVGKTHIAVSLAVSLAEQGSRVLLIDGDLGMSNADLLLDVTPERGLVHVARGEATIEEVLVGSPLGVTLLPGLGDGTHEATLTPAEKLALLGALAGIGDRFDVVIIDTAAGLSDTTLFLASGADEALVVTTPEPTSLADTYGLMRALSRRGRQHQLGLIVNQAMGAEVAHAVHRRLSQLVERFLELPVPLAGWVPFDAQVHAAVMRRRPVVSDSERSAASRQLRGLAQAVVARPQSPSRGIALFGRAEGRPTC